jgi:hypothetical protein
MKTVHIYCAQDKDKEWSRVTPATIIIDDEIPTRKEYPEAMAQFESEAQLLSEALINALPGGTIDQLLICLLKYKASRFVVRA